MDTFRVRLNCVDHYQGRPTEFDPLLHRGQASLPKDLPSVPVIRVFGATETGQKVCAHIHGAFPYLYIEYQDSLEPDTVNAFIRTLHLSIDHALAVTYRRNMYDGKTSFVAHITLVKGIPFYGYHVGYRFFLKIYMLNPLHMTRLADLLRQGAVMKQAFQPYESHMQYLAQWMCDYNLYGCAYIDCSTAKFRSPVPEYIEMSSSAHHWHDRTILKEQISSEDVLPRQSNCSIEVDICVKDILNRHEVHERPIHQDFIERMKPFTSDEKLVNSMAGLWRDETRRRKARMGLLDPGSSPFPPEVLVSMSAEPRNSQPGGWIHEEEYAEKARGIAKDELEESTDKRPISFETFVRKVPGESRVQTTLESVADLYPNRLPILDLENQLSQSERAAFTQVDESRIVAFDDEEFGHEYEGGISAISKRKLRQPDSEKSIINAVGGDMNDKIGGVTSSGSESSSAPVDGGLPTSSSELESIGVHKIRDLDRFKEDDFDIPLEFASKFNIGSDHQEIMYQQNSNGQGRKRRKVVHDEVIDTGTNSRPTSRDDTDVRFDMHKANIDKELDQVFDKSRLAVVRADALPVLDMSQHPPSNHSQGGSRPVPVSQNKVLTFPVVKDPNDPTTVLRLSQQDSSQKSHKSPTVTGSPEGQRGQVSESLMVDRSQSVKRVPNGTNTWALKLSTTLSQSPRSQRNVRTMCLAMAPPSLSRVSDTMIDEGLPSEIAQYAYYQDDMDVPDRMREYAGREFKIESTTIPFLPPFDLTGNSVASFGERPSVLVDQGAEEKNSVQRRRNCKLQTWEIAECPPTTQQVTKWLEEEETRSRTGIKRFSLECTPDGTSPVPALSQVDGPTQRNKHGFKYSQKQASTSVQHETQYMSVMSLEVHVNTRGYLVPNPEEDMITCIFWCIQSDDEGIEVNVSKKGLHVGILALSEHPGMAQKIYRATALDVEEFPSELELITRMVDIVRQYDPDILTGYEVHNNSWGYIIERARYKYDYNLCDEFSRMRSQSHGRFGKDNDRWGFNHTSTIRVTGRHMINIWRAMRGELNLLQYTMENIVFHLLHRRIPHYPFSDLTTWYNSDIPRDLAKVIDYHVSRVQMDLEILESNELIPRTSEQARLLGVDFFSVFSRGSQFKVESLMFRIAKPENLLLISPSRKQVGQQNALECLPLVMEPQSDFYPSPLLVLDFQSLYPSVMIAYNYCYSTFLGRVVNWRGRNKMGFTEFDREPRLLELFEDHINIAPNGIMYVKPEIRKSLLAKMLSEILETRVMVKSGMKVDKDDKTLQRLLNNRQLALKLIANVTYGYTSASFSGRMPCSEIADSIVQTGRETLEKAIALIHSVEKWGAEVVYGDTDSLFVYLKGRTREEAFDIGEDIAKTITRMNPRPVKLKFEKVYHPCVLLAKKRYVGFKYESKTQKEPEFDAKGIETVRRDGTPAEQKIEEKALKILFRTADLSQVKAYFQSQCSKIMRGKVSIQDFCFAKEVKLGTYSDKGPPPPGALISTRRMLEDPRTEPQYGERVPYVVITGGPGSRLIDRCVAPEVLLKDSQSELDAEYYISKNIIPPLERIFNLVGANVRQWYDEMPKFQRIRRIEGTGIPTQGPMKDLAISKKTLESYMKSSLCIVCRDKIDAEVPICNPCLEQPHISLLTLRARLMEAEKKAIQLEKVCRSCMGHAWGEEVKCDSKDCPVFYSRTRHKASFGNDRAVLEPVIAMLETKESAFDW